MPTHTQAMAAIEGRLGFPMSRLRTVAQRLREDGVLPSGAPGVAPDLDPGDIVSLVIALAADTTLSRASATVRQYRAMTPGGVALQGAPSSLETAGEALDIFADIAIHGDSDLMRRDTIEVVGSWPEIAVYAGDNVRRYVPVGAAASHWQANGHRRSTVINGAAFIDALRELFPKE